MIETSVMVVIVILCRHLMMTRIAGRHVVVTMRIVSSRMMHCIALQEVVEGGVLEGVLVY